MTELDRVFREYHETTNISCEKLKSLKKNQCSRKSNFKLDDLNRNVHLQCTPKKFWGDREIKEAKETIKLLKKRR